MEKQKWWNDRSYLKKETIFWIGSSDIHGSSQTSTPVCLINEKLRNGLRNARQTQPEQEAKRPPSNRSIDVSKREKHLGLTAVEGATYSLQERLNTQERFFSPMSRPNLRQMIAVTVLKPEIGEFSATYHSDFQHLTPGRSNGRSTDPSKQDIAQAPFNLNPRLLTDVQKSETNKLHLYLPSADSYEEDESETARSKKHVSENNDTRIFKNISKPDPRKPLPLHPSRRVIDKWTPCKEALNTAKVSVQFGGDNKGFCLSPSRGYLLDKAKNRFSICEDTNHRNCTQRSASNIGYRLGSYYTFQTAESSEYGLNIKSLNLNNDKPKGTSLSNQCRGLQKGEHLSEGQGNIQ